MARGSARVIFVCRVVLGETLSVVWWERRLMGRTPSVISLCEMPPPPKVEALAKRVSFVLTGQRQEEASVKLQIFRLCQSLSLSGEVARRSRDGEGCLPGRTPSVISLCEMPPPPRENSRPHRSTVKKSLPPYPLLTSPSCPAMMVSYQTVDGLNSWPAKQMGEKQDEREIQKKL